MRESDVGEVLSERSVPSLIRQRLDTWNRSDRERFSALVSALKIGQNHQRDLMEWLEEIAIRDSLGIDEILRSEALEKIESDPRLGRADKLKRIKEHIRRLRFPRLSETEDAVRKHIRTLGLEPQVRVSAPAGLEGGKLHAEFSAATLEEFKRCVGKLADAAEAQSLAEAFALLAGPVPDKRSQDGP